MRIPKEIQEVLGKLEKAGYESYVVGGCVRDLILKKEPEDWDITTNAKPQVIEKLFKKSFSNNKFGTVTVVTNSKNQRLKEVEITPFRIDENYSDKRHPDKVRWAKTIKEDLARRDFTINAMALSTQGKITDPFSGQKDLKKGVIKTVGNPKNRFSEDALRMMRAVRFATSFGFAIEKETEKAIQKNSFWLKAISKERIRDELLKIIMAERAADGIEFLRRLKLLKHILPELEEGYKIGQNKHHIYDCYEHNLLSLKYAAKKRFNKYVRIASLLHDIAKPRVKKGKGQDSTFYNHEIVGAKMTAQILNRLKFSNKDAEKIYKLVRYHLFYYNVDEVSESSVRRLVRQVGQENMDELLQVRMSDRIGSGVPKAEPYKLRHLKYIIDKASQDPISVKKLKINGNDIMKLVNMKPGPKIGQVLDVLLGDVLEDPKKNTKKHLENRVKKLDKLKLKELEALSKKAREERKKIEMKRDEMTKKKYWVT
ncbi:CCA tRNA nucleotidyltransferase [Patescibacteria group bacterium]